MDTKLNMHGKTCVITGANSGIGTAMAGVAKEAGVSAGVIYYYFDSKDALLIELYKTVKRDTVTSIIETVDTTQPFKLQVQQQLGNLFRYYVKHPQQVAYMEQFSRSPYNSPAIEAEMNKNFAFVAEMFERAKHEMIIKDLPQMVLVALTMEVASSLAQKQSAGLLNLSDTEIRQVIDATWEAIRR